MDPALLKKVRQIFKVPKLRFGDTGPHPKGYKEVATFISSDQFGIMACCIDHATLYVQMRGSKSALVALDYTHSQLTSNGSNGQRFWLSKVKGKWLTYQEKRLGD